MTKQEYLTCPICTAQTKDYLISTSGSLITDVKCTNRKCFFSSNYVPINVWDRCMRMVERCYSLEAENTNLKTEIAKLQADNRSLVEQMNKMDNPQIGNPSVIGFYGVNTVDPIPELLEWDGDRWLYPYPPTMEYPANDVISWVLVSAYEECKFHKGVNND